MRISLSVLALGTALLVGSAAQAENPYFWPCACGPWASSAYGVHATQNVPYFALYPPVYYSHQVPRAYGFSPFAYPGYVLTPERQLEPVSTEAVPPPLMVKNPFVQQAEPVPAPAADATGTTKPKMVYPQTAALRRD